MITGAGNTVQVHGNVFAVDTTGMTGTDQIRVPLPILSNGTSYGRVVTLYGVNYPAGCTQLVLKIPNNSLYGFVCGVGDNTSVTELTVADINSGGDAFVFDVNYRVDA